MRRYNRKKNGPIKILAVLSLVLAGLFIASKQFGKKTGTNLDGSDVLVAEYGDEKIYKSDIEKKINSIFEVSSIGNPLVRFEDLADNSIEPIAREIYLDRKIAKKAEELGISSQQKLTDRVESFRDTLTRQLYINSAVKVTEEEALNLYSQRYSDKEKLAREFRISQIVFSKESEAKKVRKLLKKDNFAKMAKKHSVRKFGIDQDGDIGFVKESDFLPKIKSTILSMKIDEISKPVEIDGVWYIVKLTDIIEPKLPSFDEVKIDLIEELRKQKIANLSAQILDGAGFKFIIRPKNEMMPNAENKKAEEPIKENQEAEKQDEAPVGSEEKNPEGDANQTGEQNKEEKEEEVSKNI